MAMCQIDQLVLRTHFSTGQLVDWVDQAILFMHPGTGGEWFGPLRKVGVRTATDLLNVTGLDLFNAGQLKYRDFWPNRQALGRLVSAINAATVEHTKGDDGATDQVRRLAVALHVAAVKLVDDATKVNGLNARIDPATPLSYDRLMLHRDVRYGRLCEDRDPHLDAGGTSSRVESIRRGTESPQASATRQTVSPQDAPLDQAADQPADDNVVTASSDVETTLLQISNTCKRLEKSLIRLMALRSSLSSKVANLKLDSDGDPTITETIAKVKKYLDNLADSTTAVQIDERILTSIATTANTAAGPALHRDLLIPRSIRRLRR